MANLSDRIIAPRSKFHNSDDGFQVRPFSPITTSDEDMGDLKLRSSKESPDPNIPSIPENDTLQNQPSTTDASGDIGITPRRASTTPQFPEPTPTNISEGKLLLRRASTNVPIPGEDGITPRTTATESDVSSDASEEDIGITRRSQSAVPPSIQQYDISTHNIRKSSENLARTIRKSHEALLLLRDKGSNIVSLKSKKKLDTIAEDSVPQIEITTTTSTNGNKTSTEIPPMTTGIDTETPRTSQQMDNIDPKQLETVNIESVNLQNCYSLDAKSLLCVGKLFGNSMKSLDLSFCPVKQNENEHQLWNEFSLMCNNLQHLAIRYFMLSYIFCIYLFLFFVGVLLLQMQ